MTTGNKADAVFEGGGVKGIGLVGALQAFEEAGFEWQNVAGTSAGAISAALVAVGYTAAEVKVIMDTRVVFRKFMDKNTFGKVPVIGPYLSLGFTNGLYKGDYFLELMRELIHEKTGSRKLVFGDLTMPKEPGDSDADYERQYKYKLRLIASDVSLNELLVLPQHATELGVDPDRLEVALAVRASMSIPFFFKPLAFREPRRPLRVHHIVDGGMLSNFPIDLFDSPGEPSWPTFGFLLWEPGSDDRTLKRVRGPVTLTRAIIETLTNAHSRKLIREADETRLVKIPTGKYVATDFDLTKDDTEWLFASGYNTAVEFLKTWDFERYKVKSNRTSEQAAVQHTDGSEPVSR